MVQAHLASALYPGQAPLDENKRVQHTCMGSSYVQAGSHILPDFPPSPPVGCPSGQTTHSPGVLSSSSSSIWHLLYVCDIQTCRAGNLCFYTRQYRTLHDMCTPQHDNIITRAYSTVNQSAVCTHNLTAGWPACTMMALRTPSLKQQHRLPAIFCCCCFCWCAAALNALTPHDHPSLDSYSQCAGSTAVTCRCGSGPQNVQDLHNVASATSALLQLTAQCNDVTNP
jgi:hypothetical protein